MHLKWKTQTGNKGNVKPVSVNHQRELRHLLEMLCTKYIDGLYGYALMLTSNEAQAARLVQDTYREAMQLIVGLSDESKLKTWLFAILRKIWRSELPSAKQRPGSTRITEDGINEAIATAPNYGARSVLTAEKEMVRAAIQDLPRALRETIFLREHEDLSYCEIAEVLDRNTSTVISRLEMGRKRLRSVLMDAN